MLRNQTHLHNLKDLAHEPGEENFQESSHENVFFLKKTSDNQIEQLILFLNKPPFTCSPTHVPALLPVERRQGA